MVSKRGLFFGLVMLVVYALLMDKYFLQGQLIAKVSGARQDVVAYLDYRFGSCPDGEMRIEVDGGYLCRTTAERSLWLDIYDSYPKSNQGKEVIYEFLDQGELDAANLYLKGEQPVSRFEPIDIEGEPTWEEDPYGERYWRFLYYSLRPTRHLLYASRTTGNDAYTDKLVEIVGSFVTEGMDKPLVWSDKHAVAFRAMVLTNTWWKLREQNELPVDVSTAILQALERHAEFMMREENFEAEHNHGLNEAAALLVVAANFPDLPGAVEWEATAKARIDALLDTLIDADGVLIENSPYYHFYALEKFWELYRYTAQYNIVMQDDFETKIASMIHYGTYILHPNLEVPMLGASLQRELKLAELFEEMAAYDPEFEYVLSQGSQGQQPAEHNILFQEAGQAIMRSGWDEANVSFSDQTQVILDVGPYRTAHSDLDAMSFILYSNNQLLLGDSGLYTYEHDNPLYEYFQGTQGHNTVVVNGLSQNPGAPIIGDLYQGEDFAYQVARHNLYPGVVHHRALMLVGHDLVLVVDYLISNKEQEYSQLFHFAPGLSISADGLTVQGRGENGDQSVTIHQLVDEGLQVQSLWGNLSPPAGLCSTQYEETQPCYEIAYDQTGKTAVYMTLLEIGEPDETLTTSVNSDLSTVRVESSKGMFKAHLTYPDIITPGDQSLKITEVTTGMHDLVLARAEDNTWTLTGTDATPLPTGLPYTVEARDGKLAIVRNAGATDNGDEVARFEVYVEGLDTYYPTGDTVLTDIPIDPAARTLKAYEQEDFLPIFGYHNVRLADEPIQSETSDLYLDKFIEQVEYATNVMGCRWYTFGEIMRDYVLAGKKTPEQACVMTFDDGHINNYNNVLPVLTEHNVVATFYIIPGRLEGSSLYMDWEQVDELYLRGHEIGSHSVDSPGMVDAGWNSEELRYQIFESKAMLEARGYEVTTFAYPYGQWTPEIIALTEAAGYIAGRDNAKDNSWRDRRPLTVSLDDQNRWHMHYYKPELVTLDELAHDMGYSTWWQSEESYVEVRDDDDDIRTVTSIKPTGNSYAVVNLDDARDGIQNSFMVRRDAEYTFEIVAGHSSQPSVDIRVLVDGSLMPISADSPADCFTDDDGRPFCSYFGTVSLPQGEHVITVMAGAGGALVDKFRIFRALPVQSGYRIRIDEYTTQQPEREPVMLMDVEPAAVQAFERPAEEDHRDIIVQALVVGAVALALLYRQVRIRRLKSQ